MNIKLSFYTPPYPGRCSYRETIDAAAEHGLTAVEGLNSFEFETPDLAVARELRAYADSRGVRFCCFSVYCRLVGEGTAETVEKVKRYADVAAILGAPYLHHTIACEYADPSAVLPYNETYFEQGILAVREIYDYAKERGVRTIYEDQGFLFNGVRNFGRFLDQVERDVGVVADFGNIAQAGEDIVDFLKAFASRVCHVHIKDVRLTADNPDGHGLPTLDNRYMHEVPLGTGEVPFAEGMALLRQVGYDGYIALETFASADTAEAVDELVQCANALMGAE